MPTTAAQHRRWSRPRRRTTSRSRAARGSSTLVDRRNRRPSVHGAEASIVGSAYGTRGQRRLQCRRLSLRARSFDDVRRTATGTSTTGTDASSARRTLAAPTVVVVGLGPGDDRWVTQHTLDAIASIPPLRAHHAPPVGRTSSVTTPPASTTSTTPPTPSPTCTPTITDRLVAAAARARRGALRRARLAARARAHGARAPRRRRGSTATVLPAMSFLDLAYARLGIDPVEAGVQLIDGHEFATAAPATPDRC